MASSFLAPRFPASASGVVRVDVVPLALADAPPVDLDPAVAAPLALSVSLGIPESFAPFPFLRTVPALVEISFCAAVADVFLDVDDADAFVGVAGPPPVPVSDPPLADPVPAEDCATRFGMNG